MLVFLLFKGKPAIIRLLRRLAKEKKNQPQKQRNSLHQQEHLTGNEKYYCTLLLDQQGTRLNPGKKKKRELEKAEPLTQIRINAIKMISKEVTEYY